MTRSIDDILNGDALTWANMTADQLRNEHEVLRRALETACKQITELGSVCHLNQSDAIYAEQRAAFLTKMLDKERAENEQLRTALAEACKIASHALSRVEREPYCDSREWSGYEEKLAELRSLADPTQPAPPASD